MDKYEANRRFFGNGGFRPGQETLIDALLSGRDCLGVMPTGGGKSLCYQIPGLLLPGAAVVISPLISLMKDQVAALQAAGLPAAYLNSAMELPEYRRTLDGLERGEWKLLYVAPERLEHEGFLRAIRSQPVSLLAVDEAHCISQWGQDFRPSYLTIPDFVAALPRRPALAAFTATATEQVRQDIASLLGLQDPAVVVTGFDRPNLYFDVRTPRDKAAALRKLLRERPGRSGIVYCATRAAVEQVCARLQADGVPATGITPGCPTRSGGRNQDDFQYDRRTVMVATNAFGMGIDKSNVSFVIHYNMPGSLEAYYQEAGRAGRDGGPAECILLASGGDAATARYLIDHGGENAELTEQQRRELRLRDYRRLEQMTAYCRTTRCLRGVILDYFGQAHPETCGRCGNCCRRTVLRDITVPAQMVLSCVRRIENRLGYSVGSGMLIAVLRGSRERRLLDLGLDRLTTYGLLRDTPKETVRRYLDRLRELGYLQADERYGVLRLTARAGDVLYRGATVELPEQAAPPEPRSAAPAPSGSEEALYDALRAVRGQIAQEAGVPAYVVFSNATLRDMARRHPRTLDELLEVSGVGEVKAARYGGRFLAALRTGPEGEGAE